tara:strand:- start:1390 stop:2217 length:828 start_codon:yes stop_codon:yes gene_type:complete
MLEITSKDVERYKDNGFVVSNSYLSNNLQNKILNAYNEFIDNNSKLTLEEMASPHLKEGVGAKHNKTKELCKQFLDIGKNEEIVSQVKKILGNDVILWGMHCMHKEAKTGKKIPWHQDGTYWPIEPKATCSVWIAITDVDENNGCMKFIPKSHKLGVMPHLQEDKVKDDGELKGSLDLKIDESSFDENKAVNCVINKGQASFHDTYLLHSSDANFSESPRKAIVLRYMPSSSLFDRSIPNRTSANGFKYDFSERPIFLVSGEAKNNELKDSNYKF